MNSNTKLVLRALGVLLILVAISKFVKVDLSKSFYFDFSKISNTFTFDFENNKLKSLVQDQLAEDSDNFGIVIETLEGELDGYKFNEDKKFPAASLYKLVLMAAIFKEIESGSLNLNSNLSAKKDYLTKVYGEVDYGYEDREEQISYTVEEAILRVATISDNFAAIMLTDKLRDRDKLTAMAKDLGLDNTTFETESIETTPADIATFFRKLYAKEVVSPSASEEIVELLSKSRLNNRIPAKIWGNPDEASPSPKIAHKTGELSKIRHDSGIVFLPGKPYLIVIMSQDLKDENQATEIMANLSGEVFKYFKNKN